MRQPVVLGWAPVKEPPRTIMGSMGSWISLLGATITVLVSFGVVLVPCMGCPDVLCASSTSPNVTSSSGGGGTTNATLCDALCATSPSGDLNSSTTPALCSVLCTAECTTASEQAATLTLAALLSLGVAAILVIVCWVRRHAAAETRAAQESWGATRMQALARGGSARRVCNGRRSAAEEERVRALEQAMLERVREEEEAMLARRAAEEQAAMQAEEEAIVAEVAMQAEGVLRVHVLRGSGLKEVERKGFSDPYIQLSLGAQTRRSRTQSETCAPQPPTHRPIAAPGSAEAHVVYT